MTKILMICSLSQNVYSFRVPLALELQKRGYAVAVSAFDTEYAEELSVLGIPYYPIGGYYKSQNPFEALTLTSKIEKIIQETKPDIVFTFMPKPNTFGVFAARKCGVKTIVAMVEGAGDAFGSTSLKWKLIRFAECLLYRRSFRFCRTVFFLNNEDVRDFCRLKLVDRQKIRQLPGIGVDLEKFRFTETDLSSNEFIMIARMLDTKGIWEYIRCAEKVRKVHPEAQFSYLGLEGTVRVADIQPWIQNGTIRYFGTTKDVRPYLSRALAFVLPSFYREGLPMSIMEAEAMGKCVITTDNVGCRDAVVNGENGILVPPRDADALAAACIGILEKKETARAYGIRARAYAEEHFDNRVINQTIIKELESIYDQSERND